MFICSEVLGERLIDFNLVNVGKNAMSGKKSLFYARKKKFELKQKIKLQI